VISIVIPVLNGGEDLRRLLEGIGRQAIDERVETVVLDSASTDGSAELAARHGARVELIPRAQFDHGATRNVGARLAAGDVLVFTSQDAYPAAEDWLACLVGALRSDDSVAGVYGRQLPHEDAAAAEQYFLEFLYGPDPRHQRACDRSELTMDSTLFSNANSAIRRSVWEKFPFVDDIIMSEDQEWSASVLLAGWRMGYEPRAAVRHSHPYTIASAFRRFFDSGVSAERAYLAGARASSRALRRRAVHYAAGELAWLWRGGHRRSIPYAIVYELAKFVGLQLGARHRHLPLWLKLRCTALPAYWTRAGATLGPSTG